VSLKPELIPIVTEMKTLSDSKSKLEDLMVDYAKLFIGPFDLLAPPYGSIYLDGQWLLMKEEFFNNFLSQWIKDFAIRIKENAKTAFYKNLAQLTLGLFSSLTIIF